MTEKTIEQKVIETTAQTLDVDASTIKLKSSFVDDLGCDSLDVVELVMAFEEEFSDELKGESIPEEEAEKLGTVEAVIKYLEGKK